ncbi:TPA: bipartate energy taxis response protein CetB, partial [Campylobacter jejuni]|nr:bipartate energy taxis response protein CetB [Campylobacter jejuni]
NKSAISTIESLYSDLLRAEQQGLNKGVEMLKNFCKDADKTYNELIFSLQEAK